MRRPVHLPALLAPLLAAAAAGLQDPEGARRPAPDEQEESEEAYLDRLEQDFDRHARRAVPRDAFDVLDDPEMVPARKAKNVDMDEPVVGIVIGKQAKAYPISALGRSELLNDHCGKRPIAVTW